MAHRILVVDDDTQAADSLEAYLSAKGFTTKVAYDGLEAVKVATEFEPAVVIMDIKMPAMNGYDAAQVLKDCDPEGKMVFIALTGLKGEQDFKNSEEAGFYKHLIKPLDGQGLIGLVDLLSELPS